MNDWEQDEAVQFVAELDGVGIGRWRWDIATQTIYWSAELRRMYGLSEHDGLPMTIATFADLIHPEDRACVIAKVSETLSSVRKGHEHRYRVVRADGTTRLILSRARLFCDASGRPKALCGIDVDLTADMCGYCEGESDAGHRESVEESVDSRERIVWEIPRFHSVQNSSDECCCICEMVVDETGQAIDYRFLQTDSCFERVTGLSNPIGLTARELVPNLEKQWIDIFVRVAFGGETLRILEGSEALGRWHDILAMPLEPLGRFAVVFRDATGRRNAERALAESEARFRNMADNAPVMVWVTEKDGRCTFLSKSWYEFTGQTPKTGLGFGWLDAVHPEDRDSSRNRFLQAQENSEGFSLDYRLRRKDGIYRWAIDAARPRFDKNGVFVGYIGSVIDITPRHEAEKAARANETRAHSFFENAGVSLWDEDFSAVVNRLDEFRAAGVTDLRSHLARNPDLVRELLDLVVIRDVNNFTVKLFGAPDKETLLRSLASVFPPGSERGFVIELEALWRGERFVEIEGPLARMDGEVFQAFFTIVFDGDRAERTLVSAADITPRKRLEERQQMLIHELNHRVKNSLAAVQAIASQSFRGKVGPEALGSFLARLHALAQAHDVLTKEEWHTADLREVIDTAISPHNPGEVFSLIGPGILLAPRQVLSFSLVLHELCTNAFKYGALSVPGGTVIIEWEEREVSAARYLNLKWTERGGPSVAPPNRTGFGSRLIKLEMDNVHFEYEPEGLTCVMAVAILPPDTEV